MTQVNENCICRICGWIFRVPVWDEEEGASYDICPSCGCTIGNEDWELKSARKFRQKWIDNGRKWWNPMRNQPENWNPDEQMKNIPAEWL